MSAGLSRRRSRRCWIRRGYAGLCRQFAERGAAAGRDVARAIETRLAAR